VLAQYRLGSVDLLDADPYCRLNDLPLGYGTVCYAVEHVLSVALSFLLDLRAPGALRLCVEQVG
jgi:hypothetical protein